MKWAILSLRSACKEALLRKFFGRLMQFSEKLRNFVNIFRHMNNMSTIKKTLLCLALMVSSLTAWSANKPARVYMFGFAASFNDSTVCFTDIQQVDSAYLDTHTKFLYERENYSFQLRDYLKGQGWEAPTCITVFSTKRQDAEKKLDKMRRKYAKDNKFVIKEVTASEFKYEAIKDEQ